MSERGNRAMQVSMLEILVTFLAMAALLSIPR